MPVHPSETMAFMPADKPREPRLLRNQVRTSQEEVIQSSSLWPSHALVDPIDHIGSEDAALAEFGKKGTIARRIGEMHHGEGSGPTDRLTDTFVSTSDSGTSFG